MGSIPAMVEPAVLKWARETVGLSTVAASRKLNLPDDRVGKWESGDANPTIAQLKNATKVYKRPMAVFFLAEPPLTFDTLRDFRRHQGAEMGEWSPDLHAEYRRAHQQREHLLELMELDDWEPSTGWRIDLLPPRDEDLAATARQNILEHSLLSLPQGAASPHAYLNVWISGLEEAGILVLTSAGGRVDPHEMRGFSLYFNELPVIMLNGADWPRGRLFTLLHEYAHLLLHTDGLCDTITDKRATSANRRLEARCNAIAAAILMPSDAVLRRPEVAAKANARDSWTYESLRSAATPFGVSAEAFLRRLMTLGRVDKGFYNARRSEFLAKYEDEERRSQAKGGSFYRNRARDLGKGYVRHVADAHRRRVIDSYTAATYLDVKASQISQLARTATPAQAV